MIDKIGDYHASFGHEVQAVGVDGLDPAEGRQVLERFAAEVMPAVRSEFPSRVWGDSPTKADFISS